MNKNITLTSAALASLWSRRQASNSMYSQQSGRAAPAISNDTQNVYGSLQKKRMLQDLSEEEKEAQEVIAGLSRINDAQKYAESLRTSRTKAKKTEAALKKLRYNFKALSAQIMRCKTSFAARQAAGAARREVQRLRNQKNTGNYDDEEIQAAITHARAMERIAKKKARHLEEEERVKVTGGPCEADIEEKREYAQEEQEAEQEVREADLARMQEETEEIQAEMEELAEEMSDEMREQMEEFVEEMSEEMQEQMEEMTEASDLLDLADEMLNVDQEMDPPDFKMLKIKHRSEEMKELAKADGEYLKALFSQLAREMEEASAPSPSAAYAADVGADLSPLSAAEAAALVPAEAMPDASSGACVDVCV